MLVTKNSACLIYMNFFFICFIATACYKNKIETNTSAASNEGLITATLIASSAGSQANGTLAGSYDELTGIFDFSVSWNHLSNVVQSIEISAGGSQPIAVTGFSSSRNGTLYSSIYLPPNSKDDLANGNYFITITTATFPYGEISGSLVAK